MYMNSNQSLATTVYCMLSLFYCACPASAADTRGTREKVREDTTSSSYVAPDVMEMKLFEENPVAESALEQRLEEKDPEWRRTIRNSSNPKMSYSVNKSSYDTQVCSNHARRYKKAENYAFNAITFWGNTADGMGPDEWVSVGRKTFLCGEQLCCSLVLKDGLGKKTRLDIYYQDTQSKPVLSHSWEPIVESGHRIHYQYVNTDILAEEHGCGDYHVVWYVDAERISVDSIQILK